MRIWHSIHQTVYLVHTVPYFRKASMKTPCIHENLTQYAPNSLFSAHCAIFQENIHENTLYSWKFGTVYTNDNDSGVPSRHPSEDNPSWHLTSFL